MSLALSASPRAAEPKTRMLRAPYLAQMHRISSRFAFSNSSSVIAQLLQVPGDSGVQLRRLGLLLAQLRHEPPHLLLERLAVVLDRLDANIAPGREHVAVLADLLQRG